ncbi:MAG: prephenate dehydratase [Alphaproteobacteria bacterium]|nr:prephenate dehydratase [Alphaproteobacteria bacterium]
MAARKKPGRAQAAPARSASASKAGVIAFQGILGAYSHLACREAYPALTPLPCPSFEDAFAVVEDGRAECAMIPIENSLGGRVADIHHLLPASSLYIIAEHFQPVHHCLLGVKGATLEGLKRVLSHEQALAQCRGQLKSLGLEPVLRADTAGAAKELSESGDKTTGAIASALAGETYGLKVLRTRVEDRIGNTTRFVIMSRRRIDPDPKDGPCLTALIFQLRSVPAALYKALGGFATSGINITKIESYLSGDRFSVAQFYAEIEGHPADLKVARALEELDYFSTTLRILGSFRAHKFRQ